MLTLAAHPDLGWSNNHNLGLVVHVALAIVTVQIGKDDHVEGNLDGANVAAVGPLTREPNRTPAIERERDWSARRNARAPLPSSFGGGLIPQAAIETEPFRPGVPFGKLPEAVERLRK